jgi:hypothetical protein
MTFLACGNDAGKIELAREIECPLLARNSRLLFRRPDPHERWLFVPVRLRWGLDAFQEG